MLKLFFFADESHARSSQKWISIDALGFERLQFMALALCARCQITPNCVTKKQTFTHRYLFSFILGALPRCRLRDGDRSCDIVSPPHLGHRKLRHGDHRHSQHSLHFHRKLWLSTNPGLQVGCKLCCLSPTVYID